MAETLNITRSAITEDGDSADRAKLPEYNSKPRRESKTRWSSQAWLLLLVLCLIAMVALGAFLYQQWLILELELPLATMVVRLLLLVGLPVLAIIGGASWLYARGQQARIVRLENDHPVSVEWALSSPLAQQSLAAHYSTQVAWANNSALRSLNQLDMSNVKPPETKAPAQIEAAQPLGLVPDSEWLPWLNSAPHGLIAGSTDSGKTTLARIAVRLALESGASGLVIDPKGKEWFGLPVVGGGRQFENILHALDGVRVAMDMRYKAYADGERNFEPLVILVDEVPDIMQSCLNASGKSISDPRWSLFARSLGSLAREVQIRVWLLTQSPNVEDIGLNGGMRSNYSRFALREKIPLLLNEEVDSQRREQLRKLYAGQQHPLATMRHGQVHLLDTRGVVALSHAEPHTVRGWLPVLQPRQDMQSKQREALAKLIRAGITRDEARARGAKFDNGLWSELAAGNE